jgi:hypothetical protein
MGVDSAYGGDDTSWCICGDRGIIAIISKKTPDTSVIPNETIMLMKKYNILPENVLFDSGGGGQVHVDTLRERGHNVRSIAFGGSATPLKSLGMKTLQQREEEDEIRYIYKNRRAEMYGILMNRLDPGVSGEKDATPKKPFAIPERFAELRRQLEPIPKQYDKEGQLYLPPKNKPASQTGVESKVLTMKDLIGCSPDEADAVVLAVFGLENIAQSKVIGAAW